MSVYDEIIRDFFKPQPPAWVSAPVWKCGRPECRAAVPSHARYCPRCGVMFKRTGDEPHSEPGRMKR